MNKKKKLLNKKTIIIFFGVAALITAASLLIYFCNQNKNEKTGESAGVTTTVMADSTVSDPAAANIPEASESAETETETEIKKKDSSHSFNANPELPSSGTQLSDFVPKEWELMDSISLDFNSDGMTDYVGVMEYMIDNEIDYDQFQHFPRILFAIESLDEKKYALSFQDNNLIRTRDEGGVYGDPYNPLTAEETSFAIHTYGGSAWRWSEDTEFTYREGIWYLSVLQKIYGYHSYITNYSLDNYDTGVGIRCKRSSEFKDIEANWNEETQEYVNDYDLTYELVLDPPPTIEQAGMRWGMTSDHPYHWQVDSVIVPKGMELTEADVILPEKFPSETVMNEKYIIYCFKVPESEKNYLGLYQIANQSLSVVAESDYKFEGLTIYMDKIYYFSIPTKAVTYHQDGESFVKDEASAIQLYSMNIDGTEQQEIFEYKQPDMEADNQEERSRYMSVIWEFSAGEIVAQLYLGDGPHLFYRMKLDGSQAQMIGTLPK